MKSKKTYIIAYLALLFIVMLFTSFSFFSFFIQILPFIIFISPLFLFKRIFNYFKPKKIKTSLHSESILQKRLKRFKSIKRGYYSLIILIVLYVISLIGPLWMNDKPLIIYFANGIYDEGENYEDINKNGKYDQGIDSFTDKHHYYFPAVKDFFGLNGDIATDVFNQQSDGKIVDFKALYEVLKKEDSENYMIMPFYKFSPTEIYSDDLDDKFIDVNNNEVWDSGCGTLIDLNLKHHLLPIKYSNKDVISGFSFEGGIIPPGCGTLTNLDNTKDLVKVILIDDKNNLIDFDYYDKWCKNNLSECLKENLNNNDVEVGDKIMTDDMGEPVSFKVWNSWCTTNPKNCLQENLNNISDPCDLPKNTIYIKDDSSIIYHSTASISKINFELDNKNHNLIATGGDAEIFNYNKVKRKLNGIVLNHDRDALDFSFFDSGDNKVIDGCNLPENHMYLSDNDEIFYNLSNDISGFQLYIDGATIYNADGKDSEKNNFTISQCNENDILNKQHLDGLGSYLFDDSASEIEYIVNGINQFTSDINSNYCKNKNTKLSDKITLLGYSLKGDLVPSKAEVLTYDANNNGKWDQLSPPSLPSGNNILGTEESGRDVFARLVDGYKISITFAIIVSTLGYSIGIIIGACLGYFGGRLDLLGVRLIEIFSSVPFLFVLMILASFMKPSLFLLALLSVLLKGWIGITMYIRGEFFREKPKDYVSAAVSMGQSNWKIMFKHILPNSLTPIITFAPFSIIADIGTLVSLDFLGYGLQPTTSSWGALLRQGAANLDNYHLLIFPVIALTLTIFMITFISEAIREAFDPRIYSRLR